MYIDSSFSEGVTRYRNGGKIKGFRDVDLKLRLLLGVVVKIETVLSDQKNRLALMLVEGQFFFNY